MDQATLLAQLLSWKLDKPLRKEEFIWDFFKSDPVVEKAFWGLYDVYDNSYLRRAMAPVDNYEFAVMKDLQRAGHRVDIVTRNNPESVPHIVAWLWSHGVEGMRVRAIRRPIGKASTAAKAKLAYDIFVDDSPAL